MRFFFLNVLTVLAMGRLEELSGLADRGGSLIARLLQRAPFQGAEAVFFALISSPVTIRLVFLLVSKPEDGLALSKHRAARFTVYQASPLTVSED